MGNEQMVSGRPPLEKYKNEIRKMDSNFFQEVAMGNIAGYRAEQFFFHNPAVGTTKETIWPVGGTVVLQTAEQTVEMLSTSANDTALGTGARTCSVEGINGAHVRVSEIATTNGLSAVTLTQKFLRVTRTTVLTSGTLSKNDGDITVQVSGGGDIMSRATAGRGISYGPIVPVPAGETAYMWGAVSFLGKNSDADIDFINILTDGTRVTIFPFHSFEFMYHQALVLPIEFLEKTDIYFEAAGTAGTRRMSTALNIIFKTN